MRRLTLLIVVALGTMLPFADARADYEAPQGTLTSPERAVAGQPFFVRSITPCPPVPETAVRWVNVFIQSQTGLLEEGIESTQADIRPDGSWEVTLSAPVDMPEGVTKSYSVHAQCIIHTNPYFAKPVGEEAAAPEGETTTTSLPPEFSYFRYFRRTLSVTGFGPSEVAEGAGPSGSSTTTSTTSTTALGNPDATTTLPTPTTLSAQSLKRDVERWQPDRVSTEELRRELALQQRSSSEVALSTASVSARAQRAPDDGGIPWWAFALAAMLAVGGVVGYGTKRESALSKLDR